MDIRPLDIIGFTTEIGESRGTVLAISENGFLVQGNEGGGFTFARRDTVHTVRPPENRKRATKRAVAACANCRRLLHKEKRFNVAGAPVCCSTWDDNWS